MTRRPGAVPLLSDEQRAKVAKRLTLSAADRSDRGQTLPLTAAALALGADADHGAARLEALVAALSVERLIVPVEVEARVADGADRAGERSTGGHAAGERAAGERNVSDRPAGDILGEGLAHEPHAPIDFVRVDMFSGPALAAFSSVEELQSFDPSYRPMAFDVDKLCLSALVETRGRILIDPAGARVLIPRPAVAALAQGDDWLPAWKDEELFVELRGTLQSGPIGDVRVAYAGGGIVRVELLINGASNERAARRDIEQALRAVGACARLNAAAERIELVPVRAEQGEYRHESRRGCCPGIG